MVKIFPTSLNYTARDSREDSSPSSQEPSTNAENQRLFQPPLTHFVPAAKVSRNGLLKVRRWLEKIADASHTKRRSNFFSWRRFGVIGWCTTVLFGTLHRYRTMFRGKFQDIYVTSALERPLAPKGALCKLLLNNANFWMNVNDLNTPVMRVLAQTTKNFGVFVETPLTYDDFENLWKYFKILELAVVNWSAGCHKCPHNWNQPLYVFI